MAAVYQEARIKSHNILGVNPEIHSYWTGSGSLLLLHMSLSREMEGSDQINTSRVSFSGNTRIFQAEIRGLLGGEGWTSDRQSMSGSYIWFRGHSALKIHCHPSLCHQC